MRDKADLHDELDLDNAEWRRLRPGDDRTEDVELAFVPHPGDGHIYVALRSATEPGGVRLVFTPTEWDAFLAGARDGEFDRPS